MTTATGLVLLLLLFLLPPCAAKHMPDWSRVQAVPPKTKIEVQLYKDEAPHDADDLSVFRKLYPQHRTAGLLPAPHQSGAVFRTGGKRLHQGGARRYHVVQQPTPSRNQMPRTRVCRSRRLRTRVLPVIP